MSDSIDPDEMANSENTDRRQMQMRWTARVTENIYTWHNLYMVYFADWGGGGAGGGGGGGGHKGTIVSGLCMLIIFTLVYLDTLTFTLSGLIQEFSR